MSKKIHWGILGLGKIAHKFAADLQLADRAVLHAVASRSLAKAQAFRNAYQATHGYGSYEELVNDPAIAIIYIATPHAMHFENTMLCLRNNKAVLCEKPMGLNLQQVAALAREAQLRKVFLMEGIWTRFIPATEKVIELVESGVLGDILHIQADFGFQAPQHVDGRLFNKQLGGGSLLDIGIYPIFLSVLVLGMPTAVKAIARITATGVDGACSMLLNYAGGAIATLSSTLEANTPIEATIYGTQGSITMHRRFHQTEKITFVHRNKETTLHLALKGNGYLHEIEEVNNCLLLGKTQSEKLPLQTSLAVMTVIDAVKKEIGLHYNTTI